MGSRGHCSPSLLLLLAIFILCYLPQIEARWWKNKYLLKQLFDREEEQKGKEVGGKEHPISTSATSRGRGPNEGQVSRLDPAIQHHDEERDEENESDHNDDGDVSGVHAIPPPKGNIRSLFGGAIKEVLSCPRKLFGCVTNRDCRSTMACAGHCLQANKAINLTCYVPCTYGKDQEAFLAFTDCVIKKRDTYLSDPGIADIPIGGKCLDVMGQVVTDFQVESMEGEWYVVAGGSNLETYDCQKNRVTRKNRTHWQIDEYYQGEITGMGFKWGQCQQMISARTDQTVLMDWRPADGAGRGYEATYHVLASTDTYKVFYYCAPLQPSTLYWSSFLIFSRMPMIPPQALEHVQGLLERYDWDTPLHLINHENCTYRIAPSNVSSSSSLSSPALPVQLTREQGGSEEEEERFSFHSSLSAPSGSGDEL